jgi:phytoene dehydrogenase-like protein
VRLKTPVERVLVSDGEVRGVLLAGGERIAAPAVVVNADFIEAATRLLEPAHWPAQDREALAAVRPACSAFMVHLGVRGGFPDARPLTRVVTPAGAVEVVLPSLADPAAAPDGYATVELIRLVEQPAAAGWFGDVNAHDDRARREHGDYLARKAALGDEMIAIAEAAFPGLSKRVVVRFDASPVTFRRYAWSTAGSIYGADAPARLRATKSPIRGLVFAGAHTHGPGVEAVFISGARAAQAIVPGVLTAPARTWPAADAGGQPREQTLSAPSSAPRRPVATARA